MGLDIQHDTGEIMSTTTKTIAMIGAALVVLFIGLSASIFGAFFHETSPLNFMIYVGEFGTFAMLALIVYMSFSRSSV